MQNRIGPIAALQLVALVAALTLGFGCGSTSKVEPAGTYVYVAQAQRSTQTGVWVGSIAQLRLHGNGMLTNLDPTTVPTSAVPSSLAVDPSGRYLLAKDSGTILEYAIENDGTLTLAPPTGVTAFTAVFTPDGHFVITTGVGSDGLPSNTLNVYSFGSDGLLTLVGNAGITSQAGPIAVDASSRFVYFGSPNDNRIYEYSLSGGTLTPIGSIAAGSINPFWLSASPKGFLYSPINGAGGGVNEFQINASNGTLGQVSSFVVCPNGGGFPVAFTPSGEYAYTSCGGTVSQFSVDATTGMFAPNGPNLSNVGVITMDPSGKVAFAFTDVDTVSQFNVGANGTLSPNGSVVLSTTMLGQSIVSTYR